MADGNGKTLFTVPDVAQEGSISTTMVREIADDLGVGEEVGGRIVFTAEEKDAILDEVESEEEAD